MCSLSCRYEYHWADGVKIKKPVKMSAPEYIMQLFTWIDEQIANPELFPVEEGELFRLCALIAETFSKEECCTFVALCLWALFFLVGARDFSSIHFL